jgi:hypothetical protein
METLVDKHIRESLLKECPLHQNQAPTGKCTKTALHNVVTQSESAIEPKEVALRDFLHTEGTFNRLSFDVIIQAAEKPGTESTISWWTSSMLESRETQKVSTLRGCQHGGWGGVLLPLLWNRVVEDLYGDSMMMIIIQ